MTKETLEQQKIEMLSIVAFGCNKNTESALKKLFENYENYDTTLFFYEYFPLTPICNKDISLVTTEVFFAPYLERILRKFEFIPDISNITSSTIPASHTDIRYVPRSRQAIKNFLSKPIVMTGLANAIGGAKLYQQWLENNKETLTAEEQKSHQQWLENNKEILESPYNLKITKLPGDKYADSFFAEGDYDLNDLDQLVWQKILSLEPVSDRISFLKDFLIACKPWLAIKEENAKVNVIYTPIVSQKIFYGYLLLFYKKNRENGGGNIKGALKKELWETMKNKYLPILMLFENYWEEWLLKESLSKTYLKPDWSEKVLKLNGSNYNQRLIFLNSKGSPNKLEDKLGNVWEVRKNIPRDKLKEHLIFAKYNIASPAILEIVQNIAKTTLKKTGDSLPTALVIGGSGSGKDSLAKIIGLFSEEYNKGPFITVNMASYKPEALSTPLLSGLKICLFRIKGLFELLMNHKKAVFIADELNSLDIDAQGALLRVLENSEIVPLGRLPNNEKKQKEDLDFLFIGVMNEDPEKLTRESTLKQILNQKHLFGGAIGEIIYDFVRSRRRLRDDLYYRLIRGGKIVIPDLDDRKEDIPILFYINAIESIGADKLSIDLDAYDILMSEKYHWPGNVRQLQAITKMIIAESVAEAEKKVKVTEKTEITAKAVRTILEKEMQ